MKLHNLTLENFRSFDRYAVNHLGRINLLVGTNNSGKTSILEAAYILMSSQPLSTVWNILLRRGEVSPKPNQPRATVPTDLNGEVRHLFRGRALGEEPVCRLGGRSAAGHREARIWASWEGIEPQGAGGFAAAGFAPGGSSPTAVIAGPALRLSVQVAVAAGSEGDEVHDIHEADLDSEGGLEFVAVNRGSVLSRGYQPNITPLFVDSASMTSRAIARSYNDVVLTAEEDLVIEAVRLISPEIKRIAAIGAGVEWPGVPARDGIYVRLDGVEGRVPLGSMGDGSWRILGLALAVVHAQDKILLIDEIDIGLHYSVMGKMWRFLDECSKRFNVQIIATTHSRDCYQSLAEICREDVIDQSEITIQRIDRTRAEAVVYSEAEIIAAADRDVEVR